MGMHALATTASSGPTLRVIDGNGGRRAPSPWWEKRAFTREIVGGCPDHWWKPTAPRTVRCTCERFA